MKCVLIEKLSKAFDPEHLDVIDESHKHRGHPGVEKAEETHFRIILVSRALEGLSRMERHRKVHKLLDHELKTQIHALSMKLLTPEEWQERA